MSVQRRDFFNGTTTLTDTHDSLQTKAGNATWFNKFISVVQGPKRHIAEVMPWLFHQLGLCCVIVGEFALYVGGKLASHSDLITIYMAYHPQMLSSEITVLLQIEHAAVFFD
jgi:hypothetical protein